MAFGHLVLENVSLNSSKVSSKSDPWIKHDHKWIISPFSSRKHGCTVSKTLVCRASGSGSNLSFALPFYFAHAQCVTRHAHSLS